MDVPEYYELFQSDGGVCVEVKFKDHEGSVADLSMNADEIVKLIDSSTRQFYTEIKFDDWLFEVYRYSIDPIKKKLNIMVREKAK